MGSVADPSDDVIATVGVADDTTFQFASTAFTVTDTDDPAVTAVGEPDLPVAVPGSAVSPGSSTCNFDAEPAVTLNVPEAPLFPATRLEVPVPVAVSDTPDSAFEYVTPVTVTAEDPTAIVPDVVPPRVPPPEARVSVTVPVAPVLFTALPYVSVSMTVTEKPVPAVCDAMDPITSFDAVVGLIVNPADVPDLEPPDAVTVCNAPAEVSVIECEASTPDDNDAVVPPPDKIVDVEVSVTADAYEVCVLP